MNRKQWGFFEFFAGGGLARLGLGSKWKCYLANDICEKKASAYRLNFGNCPELTVDDICNLRSDHLRSGAMLAWASFPCQDLSLAGSGRGLSGARSGTFTPFWNLIDALAAERRATPLVVLENVTGAITSNSGTDFRAIVERVVASGYRVGPLVIDAAQFVPQSRPRLFIVAVSKEFAIPKNAVSRDPDPLWHTKRILSAYRHLPDLARRHWLWWKLPAPPPIRTTLTDIVENNPTDVSWHTAEQTQHLLALMSRINMQKLEQAQRFGKKIVGTIYKRARPDARGNNVQRAEVRFDQISGCLRTPIGGSSRQTIIVVEGDKVRSRLLSAREAARLMGVSDSYKLPKNYNESYHIMGDGLAVPVVSWLETNLLRKLAQAVDCQIEAGRTNATYRNLTVASSPSSFALA